MVERFKDGLEYGKQVTIVFQTHTLFGMGKLTYHSSLIITPTFIKFSEGDGG